MNRKDEKNTLFLERYGSTETIKPKIKLDATKLRKGWVIRPAGALGTCGWINGQPWTVEYVTHKPTHIPERKD